MIRQLKHALIELKIDNRDIDAEVTRINAKWRNIKLNSIYHSDILIGLRMLRERSEP